MRTKWLNVKNYSKKLLQNRHCTSDVIQRNCGSQACDTLLTTEQANKLVMKLTVDERKNLTDALRRVESEEIRAEYEGQLAGFRWRSKFGRPSKVPKLGDVDPTGSFCPLPDDWLMKKYAETVPPPTRSQLLQVGLYNAVPFIGFGFLDNSIMIICGDSIEVTLGSLIAISTMAAAALGNTFSDILGIGSAYYVERIASSLGFKAPNLSPIQLEMVSSRYAANVGRCIGITIGCLLGMFPLLFISSKSQEKQDE